MKTSAVITIGRVLLLLVALSFALILASCSSVAVTRLPNGTLHAGPTSFGGKQFIGKATIRTREGDEIVLENYGTQNPDPETTKTITNGLLINTGINAAQKLAQPVANGVGDFIPSNP